MRSLVRFIFLLWVAPLGACQAPASTPGIALTPKRAPQASSEAVAVSLSPALASVAPPSGEARLTVRLTVVDASAGYRLAAVPTAWQSVRVTLFSPTANTGFDATKHEVTLPSASFAVSGVGRRADATFPILRPSADYRAELFVTNSAGTVVTARLAGSAAKVLMLNAGANVLSFVLTLNGDEATYTIDQTTSEAGNRTEATEATYVSTLAGSSAGSTDATGTAAKFFQPFGVAADLSGNLYVADYGNHRIRKVTPAGVVTTLAGSTQGSADGTGAAAQFNFPTGVAVDGVGNVYVADFANHRIRKVTPAGVVTTLAGSTSGYVDATGTAARFNSPFGVAVDASGNVYVAASGNNAIRKVSPAGVVSTLAGGTGGTADGTGAAAHFNAPLGVALDREGTLYVADTSNHRIRKVTPAGVVTTLAGSTQGYADGTGSAAQFNTPYDLEVDTWGNVYVADPNNFRIRKVTPAGVVTTFAGSVPSSLDGPRTSATFNPPRGLAVDSWDNLYVTESNVHRLRRIGPSAISGPPVIVRGDTVTLDTGLMANQPGVEYLLLKLSGDAYPGGCLLKRFDRSPDGASWNRYTWNTTADNTAAGAGYAAATFAAAATGQTQLDGQLDFEAYDRYDRLAGKASLSIKAMGRIDSGITFEISAR